MAQRPKPVGFDTAGTTFSLEPSDSEWIDGGSSVHDLEVKRSFRDAHIPERRFE